MKREHSIESKLPEGCVFYAPLTEGDTTDHVSMQELVPQNGTVGFDYQKNAYCFTGPSSKSMSSWIGSWNNLDMDINLSNVGFTILMDVYTSYQQIVPIVFGGRQFAQNVSYANMDTWCKYAITLDSYSGTTRYSKHYCDGVLKATSSRGTTPTVFTAIGKQRVEIDTNNTSHTFWMKNAMIFNRALSQNEIIDIQGI